MEKGFFNRLFSFIGIVLYLIFFSSICDALIKVSYVVPDNGPFNSERLYTKYFKAPGYEKVLRRITIYGSGFTRYMDINFTHGNISKPVAEFKYLSQTQVQVIPPDWEMPKDNPLTPFGKGEGKNPVTVDIEIRSQVIAGNRDVLKKGFTYNPPPEVESIEPNIGPQDPSFLPDGKEIIKIKGSGFIEKDPTRPGLTIQVSIGTKQFSSPALIYKNDQNISLEFSEPLYSTEGAVDIIVINPDSQTSAVNGRQYMIIGQPTIRIIRPNRGPITGGNVVQIEGARLEGGNFSVRVNGQDVLPLPPLSPPSTGGEQGGGVVCIMPSNPPPTPSQDGSKKEKNVDVQVVKHTINQRGRSFNQISNPLKYTYLDMVVGRIEPEIGEKGIQVTINGKDFFTSDDSQEERSTVEVFFGGEISNGEVIGGAKGVNLDVINSTTLTVEVPEGNGIVPVFVQQSWKAEEKPPFIRQIMSAENKFTYSTGVAIDDFNPKKGSIVGGTAVKITGVNFYPDPSKIKVTFGGVPAKVLNASGEELNVLPPSHDSGIVAVIVKNPDGSSDSRDGFEYIEGPVIEKVEPNFGPIEGGNPIEVIGKNLLETSVVRIGGEKATLGTREYGKVVVNAVPPLSSPSTGENKGGAVDVIAYVEGQHDAVLQNGYTYRKIEARAIIPDNGPLSGNNTVTIQGRDFEGWDDNTAKAIAPTVKLGNANAPVISYTQDSIEVVAPKDNPLTPFGKGEGTGTVSVTIIVRYLFTMPGETRPKEVKQTNTNLTYRYNSLPVIVSFRPLAGNKDDNLFIEGSGFLEGAEVKVGTTTVQPVSVTATQMRIIIPAPPLSSPRQRGEREKSECEVDIAVVNPDGQEATAPDKFEYLDCTSSVQPSGDDCSHPPDGWRATLTLSSGANSTTLTFGIDPEATDGFNPGLDSTSPPLAPVAQFNAAFAGDFADLAADIRGFNQLENSWIVKLTSKDSVTFKAEVNEIPECFLVQLSCCFDNHSESPVETTKKLGGIDLRTQVSGNIRPGEHLLMVKPAGGPLPSDGIMTVTIPLERGWNLISFPGELVDASPQAILGGTVLQVLDGTSASPAALLFGEGYWVLSLAPVNLEVVLKPGTKYTRAVKRGWNLIGSIIYDVPMPEGVIQLASWNAKTQEYESPTTLVSYLGYWAFVLEDRTITVSTTPPPAPGAPIATSLKTFWTLPLTLTDVKGTRTILEIGIAPQATSGYDQQLDRFVLPPVPHSPNTLMFCALCSTRPLRSVVYSQQPVFKLSIDEHALCVGLTKHSIRTRIDEHKAQTYAQTAGFLFEPDQKLSLQRSVISMGEDGEARWSLQVSSPASEATLHWNSTKITAVHEVALRGTKQSRSNHEERSNPATRNEPELSLELVDGNRRVDMSNVSTYQLSPGLRKIQLVLRRKTQEIKPSKSMLLQNFPNPFNPETWIPYQLMDSAEVSLTIYDVHGRIVRQLNLGRQAAGTYTDREKAAYWDGRNDFSERVSSGLYFYRLTAGDFSAVRRMVIAK